MEINATKMVKVNAKTLVVTAKVRDSGAYILTDQDGAVISDQDGYVPGFFPGEHYGDYLMLHIDMDTGVITNWKKPSAEDVQEWVDGASE